MGAAEKMGEFRTHFRSVAAANELIELCQWVVPQAIYNRRNFT